MLRRIGLGLAAIIILVVVGFFLWRGMAQNKIEKARHINPETGIVIVETVMIGGIEQAITIRGHDPSAPILLALHGGPGGAIKGNTQSHFVKAVPTSPYYAFGDVLHFKTAADRSIDALLHEMQDVDVREMGLTFEVPMFFLLGRHDHMSSANLAEAYIAKISAPHAKTIWFEESRHFPIVTEAEKFTEVLIEQVRPLAD